MPEQRPSNMQALQDTSALFKGSMSTAKIFTTLFITDHKIPRNISTSDPALKQAVALNAEAASTRNQLKSGASEISALLNDITSYVTQLGNFKSTISLQETFEGEFGPKKQQIAAMVKERNAVVTDLNKLITDQQAKMTEIFTRVSKKEMSPEQAKTEIRNLGQAQDQVTMSSVKLLTAEKSLQSDLGDLRQRVKSAADVVAPPTVQETQRERPGVR